MMKQYMKRRDPKDKSVKLPKVNSDADSDEEYRKKDTVENKLSWRRGYEEGLKWLVSTNFKDFEADLKPAFGVPMISYSGNLGDAN